MSVIIDSSHRWQANRWISFKLFRDCLRFTKGSTEIECEIEFLEKVSIDLLDLTDFSEEGFTLFKELLDQVITYNQESKGADMADSSYFEMYYTKILELQEMLSMEGEK